ncbi:type III restriction endonuclease subunit R [Yersinia massiliensis]|uniref:type III restriction endonuclease subunit R n=1 Tax=Yersinia massiliensis TaxID=419257 RepID=UPI000C14D50C|nr:type III restriction endonuclease subunit R [Yersinia massiliensis]PHZ21496.1 type III restriction endonuclease subunit R [Yersinia massiliensis]
MTNLKISNTGIYKFIKAECGAGKTKWLIDEINNSDNSDNRFLIVQGKLDLLKQTFESLLISHKLITSLEYSNVETSINEFLLKPHCNVLGITSKSFFKIDPVLLVGWRVYLDDVVNFHAYKIINESNNKIKAILEGDIFSKFEEISEKYSTATKSCDVTGDILKIISSQFEMIDVNDYFLFNNDYFQKKYTVVDNVSIEDYDDKCQLTMLAWIDIQKYKNCDLTMLANKFEQSLLYKSDPTLFQEIQLNGLRERVVPLEDRLVVRYFSKKKVLSKTFRDEHRAHFESVIDYINNELQGTDYYYTRNNSESFSMNGKYVPVDTRGMNNLQKYKTCVWLVSCRPSPVESKMTELFFGISGDDIVRAREYEILYQFVQRGCLRDFDSSEQMIVYVFDEQQALSLGGKLEYIDIGIDDIVTGSVGHPRSEIPQKLRNAFAKWVKRNEGADIASYLKWKAKQELKYSQVNFESFDEKIFNLKK